MLETGHWELAHGAGMGDCSGPHLQPVFIGHFSALTKAPSQVPQGV